MREGPLFDQLQSGDALFYKALRFLILLSGVFLLAFTGILELTWPQQIVLGILTVALVIWMDRSSGSYLVTLTLMMASMFSTFRYGFWRVSTTLKFFLDPGSTWSFLDGFFICLLLFAEIYAFVVLFLGYFQTLWPLRRTPVSLPDEITQWPAVDLLIPTYNEPLSLVKYTALAAMNIDWPADRLNVYILDDGKREEFRHFAEEACIGYMTRDDNEHAKAGNINHALAQLDAPYVVIFDCDHVPTRSFLQITMGWFLRDKKLGMLQTPHHFYSPDPFERNLDQFRTIPNEGELFNGIVQDGNDFWNATFFCGSCAVLRRSALDQIGGIAVETVTEDAHTSLRMQRNGWNTAYINIPQAAGLATERLSGHIRQRIRWARGMVQILRTENPLFARGLSAAQRLCYFNAMTHFLYALPRLIFLTAPLVYLIFGHVNLPGYWLLIFAYALPHLVLANIANSRIQGQHRHSFWNQIYETVLAPYILLPTLFAFLNPRFGNFDVTAKGGVVTRRFFDSRIAQPFLLLSALNAFGILCAIPRFFPFPGAGTPSPLHFIADMYDGGHAGTILMNLLWACFNMVILGVATSVAWESRQRRQAVRLPMSVPADVELANGAIVRGVTSDMSSGGLMVRIERAFTARVGDPLKLTLPVLDGNATLPATIVGIEGSTLRAQFDPLTLQQEEALTMVLYSRADTWLGLDETREADRPLTSLRHIVQLAGHGFARTFRSGAKAKESTSNRELAPSIAPLLVVAILLSSSILSAQVHPFHAVRFSLQNDASTPQIPSDVQSTTDAQPPEPTPPPKPPFIRRVAAPPAVPPPDTFDNVVNFSDLGVPRTIVMQGLDAFNTIHFSLPQTQVVKTATMHLRYHPSPGLIPSLSHLKVSLNGNLFATLPVVDPHSAEVTQATGTVTNSVPAKNSDLLESTVTLPVDALTRDNQLTFEFVGHYASQCEDPTHSTLWAHIDNNSTIEFTGTLSPLHDDLKLLPAPFYEPLVNPHPVIPIVFLGQPTPKALQAAGIIASWFGILADSRPIRFSVSVGVIPAGNAIVIGQSGASLPASLQINSIAGPTILMRPNPSDPYSKVLILTGETDADVLSAALAFTLQRDLLSGDRVRIPAIKMPAPREADDAPRWLSTEKNTPIGDLLQTSSLQTDGSNPVAIYLRLPPDLFYGTRQNLGFHLGYRYNGVPLADDSSLQVYLNDAYIHSTPLSHSDKPSPARIVPFPVSEMRPFSNSILLRFFFQLAKKPDCPDTTASNLQGSILKDSYLDLKDIPHLAVLPNLEIFANAGYPFTRKADLSDTAIVLPDNPNAEEIELYLTLMAHFGAQTGYPVLNVTVTNAEGMRPDAHKDYLVLGTVDDQPAINRLNPSLPVSVDGSGLHIQDTQDFFAQLQHAWWKVRSSDHIQSGQLETAGSIPDALIEGVEWPSGSKQSVVVIALRDKSVIPDFISTFLQTSQSSDISQSVSVLHGSHFSSYRIGNDVYRVGSLSLWLQLNMLFADYQWLMVISTLVVCFLLAVILRSALRRRARARLQGNSYTHPA
ncbi:UDP-forming cellulose synthase catalytic subunit [Tunturiibacter gelidoferens]|uniref:Cellulose synthase (UDP-forming) n=1 Tax=Tunturiibacter gelidiferens TaxID=3069689 RepID=A0ACC5NUJ7_9BACT|nr:UDP-forming cellulose synthase catalytic subunit [Edaphobacter lichenicola]MBB5338266.1 cellulose synthase (UDP-forming) [Edaphobacter lichenicola]